MDAPTALASSSHHGVIITTHLHHVCFTPANDCTFATTKLICTFDCRIYFELQVQQVQKIQGEMHVANVLSSMSIRGSCQHQTGVSKTSVYRTTKMVGGTS